MTQKLIIVFASAIILFSCKGNTSPDKKNISKVKANTSASNNAGDENLSGTHGIFSYTVKGQHIVARNYVQHSNLFINEVTNDAANGMLKIEVTPETSSVFKFNVSNSGTTAITNYSPSLENFADKKAKAASYMEGGTYKSYYGDNISVNITSIDASRVSGTFSGTFKAEKDDGGATITITDGSFDLPFGKN